jgi:hypothetical protein
MKPNGDTSEEFGTRELLCTLADAYDKLDVAHGKLSVIIAFHPHHFFLGTHTRLVSYLCCQLVV